MTASLGPIASAGEHPAPPTLGVGRRATWPVAAALAAALLIGPDGPPPAAVRVTAYHGDGAGGFVNGRWLVLPVPPRE